MTQSFDDELVHKTVLELFNMVKSKQAEVDELQKRIDLAIERINIFYMTNGMSDLTHDEIYGILKGTTNEQ